MGPPFCIFYCDYPHVENQPEIAVIEKACIE